MHELGCFFGQSGIDVDAGTNLESCHLSEAGNDSQMPQVIVTAPREGRIHNIVEIRVVEPPIQLEQYYTQDMSQFLQYRRIGYPLPWHPASKRGVCYAPAFPQSPHEPPRQPYLKRKPPPLFSWCCPAARGFLIYQIIRYIIHIKARINA